MVKRVLLGVGIFLLPFFLFCETNLSASLSGMVYSAFGEDSNTTTALGQGSVDIKSSGNNNVKSQISLNLYSTVAGASIDVKKAWVKFRYPKFRGMIGKNRVSWGEGVVYNAGDVIFDDFTIYNPLTGNSGEDLDLTADELRSANRIMATVNIPLGRFTFVEGIYMPYNFSITDIVAIQGGDSGIKGQEIGHHSAGGRFLTRLGGIKVETGYLFDGYKEIHKPYVSFNGTALMDYHLSSSVNIPTEETGFDSWKDSLKISAGVFYLFELDGERTLTLRLESMVKPYEKWKAEEGVQTYALSLYPEIAFVPNEEFSFFLRSLFSPIDISTRSTFGVNWKTYQGFTIGSFFSIDMGEEGDLYSWEGEMPMSITLMVTHKF
jgi:hypothetical protein